MTKEISRVREEITITYIKAIPKALGIFTLSKRVTIGDRADIKITATNRRTITSLIKKRAQRRAMNAVKKKIVLWEISIL